MEKVPKKNTFFNKLFPITFELFFRQLNKRINFFFPSIFFLSNGYVILGPRKEKKTKVKFFFLLYLAYLKSAKEIKHN